MEKKLGNIPSLQEIAKPTKVERKAHVEEQKRVLKAYSSSKDSEEEIDEEQLNIPNAFKWYTIQDRKFSLETQNDRNRQHQGNPMRDMKMPSKLI